MAAFADVDDYIARLNPSERDLSQDEKDYIDVLLSDASAKLSGMLAEAGVEVDETDETQAANLTRVVCNMVREYSDAESRDNMGSMSQGIGSTNVSVQWSTGLTNFYVSDADLAVLGIKKRARGRTLHPDTSTSSFECADWWRS